jgi:hypothetical protein
MRLKIEDSRNIRRYTRRPKGEFAAVQKALLWSDPTFDVKVTDRGIQFRFVVSLSDEAIKLGADTISTLFASDSRSWRDALVRAYNELPYGRKGVQRTIAPILSALTDEAFRIWLAKTWDRSENEERKNKELGNLAKKLHNRTGPRPDPVLAVRASLESERILPAVRALRKRLRKEAPDDVGLAAQITLEFPLEDFHDALRRATKNPKAALGDFVARGGDLDVRKIAEFLVAKRMNVPASFWVNSSVSTHIKFGFKIREILSDRT